MLGSVSFGFGLITAIASELPKLDPQRQLDHQVNGYIYDSTGKRVLAVLRGSEARTLVKYEDVSDPMRHAIVAIEDRRFWEHDGVDLRGILRALAADIRQQKVVEGGSTITQQFVKNALDRDQKTIARKVREAAFAWQLERSKDWPKRRILQEYLNTIYFGNGAYGVQQAARTYFQHGAKDLTIAESALLAGIPADPNRYDPVTNPKAALARRATVLNAMLEEGKVTLAQLREATATPLPDPDDVRLGGIEGPAQHFVNYVKQQLIDEYGSAGVFGGGLRVRTTIDLELQRKARDAISKWLTQPDGPSAALVAIDPRNGAVRAMVGGNNYRKSQFNLAVQGVRQPGSSFKPFVLATALRQGISPATHFTSEPQSINLGDKYWVVGNYEDSYLGSIDLETATVESDNAVYAQLTQLVGSKNVAETARDLGIRSKLDGYYAIGLGAEAVNPLELARAYATFAYGGRRVDGAMFGNKPRVIEQVTERGGRKRFNKNVPREALDLERGRDRELDPAAGAALRHGPARVHPGQADGRQDGHDGELRRRLVRRLHAAARGRRLGRLSDDAEADADRVPGRAGRGRHVPRPDLEVVHGAGARRTSRRSASRTRPLRTRRPSSSSAAAPGSCSTTASATRPRRSSTSRGAGRRRRRTASRTRSPCRMCAGSRSPTRRPGSKRSPSRRSSSTSLPCRCRRRGSSSTSGRGAGTARPTTGSSSSSRRRPRAGSRTSSGSRSATRGCA